jgi:hypothetical protein
VGPRGLVAPSQAGNLTLICPAQSLIDPKVKKRLILVFHAWSIQYKVGWSLQ